MGNYFLGNKGKDCYDVTRISLVSNIDGLNTDTEVIGFVQEDPLCVLTYLMRDYFICKYNRKMLYPMFSVGYDHALAVDWVGSYYNPATLKPVNTFVSVLSFVKAVCEDLEKCRYNFEYDDEPVADEIKVARDTNAEEFLKVLIDARKLDLDIQWAINKIDFVKNLCRKEDESTVEYLNKINTMIQTLPLNYKTLKFVKFLYSFAIENILY